MFLITENIIQRPLPYIRTIVPAVTQLATSDGGIFLNRLFLTPDKTILDAEKAADYAEPLTRVVVLYFQNECEFNAFWSSVDRRNIWARGKSYARYSDIAVQSGTLLQQGLTTKTQQEADIANLRQLGLTPREAEVLYWLSQGKSNADIAYICTVSLGTVKNHVYSIYEKLGVKSRAAATNLAAEAMRAEQFPMQFVF